MAETIETITLPDGVPESNSLFGVDYLYYTNAQKELKRISASKMAAFFLVAAPQKLYSDSTTELSVQQLNTLYPNVAEGTKIYVKAVNMEYEKLTGIWAKKPIDITAGYVDATGYDLNLLQS